ncbi:MAG: DUF4919 domain-containing protein [Blastocatellia bacterium]|nr:DUF4919 domain-containing protein [Blastocatellia bacterium]
MRKICLAALLTGLFAFGAFAQSVGSGTPAGGSNYERLVSQVRAGNTDVDYKALRVAHSETKGFSGIGIDPKERGKLAEMIRSKKYKEAIDAAEKILATNYVEMSAHIYASMAAAELQDKKKADFHQAVYLGLINSIVDGSDGAAPATAYTVISNAEIFQILQALEYRRTGQTMTEDGGKRYAVVTAKDAESGQDVKIFFNIDIPMKSLPAGAGRGMPPRPRN